MLIGTGLDERERRTSVGLVTMCVGLGMHRDRHRAGGGLPSHANKESPRAQRAAERTAGRRPPGYPVGARASPSLCNM